MANRVVVQCPSCSTKLSISDTSKLGKKIRCSKCSEIFVAEAIRTVAQRPKRSRPVRSAEDEYDFDDASEDYGDSLMVSLPPRSTSVKRPSTSSRTGNTKPSGNVLLIIGSVVSVFLLLGVGGYVLFMRGPGANTEVANSSGSDTNSLPASGVASIVKNPVKQAPPTAESGSKSNGAAQHGETAEVQAANSADLPVGTMGLTARTRWFWNKGRGFDVNGTTVNVVELVLDIQGDILQKTFAFGRVEVKTLRMSPEQPIEVFRPLGSKDGVNPLMYFAPYDPAASNGTYGHANGHMRVMIPLQVGEGLDNSTVSVEGEFTIRTGNTVEEIAIPDVRAAANKPLENATLRAAGVELFLQAGKFQNQNSETAYLRIGPRNGVGPLVVKSTRWPTAMPPDYEVDPSGNTFSTQATLTFPNGNLHMDIRLYSDLHEVTVPFRFDNVPLPSLDMRPKK